MSDIQNKRKVVMPPQRRFLGKTENFKNNEERKFNQRMLKAYLAGRKFFDYGYEYVFGQRQPKQYEVLQSSGGIGV